LISILFSFAPERFASALSTKAANNSLPQLVAMVEAKPTFRNSRLLDIIDLLRELRLPEPTGTAFIDLAD
jgi:hypothetical protein